MKKTMWKLTSLVLALSMLVTALAGCGKKEEVPENPDDAGKPGQEEPAEKPEVTPEETPSENETADPEESGKEKIFVYIGDGVRGFEPYETAIEGDMTGEKLIAAIADLTGWNLEIYDFFSGKGGMTVSFTPECALFAGPPEVQKDEFFAQDNYTFARMILDSVQETLRRNFVLSPGDPAALDIWYCVGDDPITIENITIPIDEPYDGGKVFG